MKRIFKIILITLFLGICMGCERDVNKVSYIKFNEYFLNKEGYRVLDSTDNYDINIRKYLEAGQGDFQIFFVEYDSEKSANEYIEGLKEDKDNKVTEYSKYTYVENTNGKYMVVYKIDNIVVIGKSNDKKYKSDINGVLRDLGY